jgi:hypothetical protein
VVVAKHDLLRWVFRRDGKPGPEEVMSQPIIFLHILKTAGTAFRNYLEQSLAPGEAVLDLGDPGQAEAAKARFDGLSDEEQNRIRIFFGHMADVFCAQYPDAIYATVLRDPLKRALSQYVYEHFNLEGLGLEAGSRPLPGEVPVSEFWDFFLVWGTSYNAGNFNLQTRSVSVFLGRDPAETSLSDIAGMIDRFPVIGVQDHFALFMFLFCRTFGFPLRPMPVVYSFAQGVERYIPQWVSDEVARTGDLDAELYRLGRQKFDRAVARMFAEDPESEPAWEQYQRDTKAVIEQDMERRQAG